MMLTLTLSGCQTNDADYYRVKAELEQYELEVDILDHDITWINQYNRYSKLTYQESYKDEYIFHAKTIYAYCIVGECDLISEKDYQGGIQ